MCQSGRGGGGPRGALCPPRRVGLAASPSALLGRGRSVPLRPRDEVRDLVARQRVGWVTDNHRLPCARDLVARQRGRLRVGAPEYSSPPLAHEIMRGPRPWHQTCDHVHTRAFRARCVEDPRVSAPALSELTQAAVDFPAELITGQHDILVSDEGGREGGSHHLSSITAPSLMCFCSSMSSFRLLFPISQVSLPTPPLSSRSLPALVSSRAQRPPRPALSSQTWQLRWS